MTFMEVIVAALVLTIGSLAVLSLVGASVRNNYRAEQSQVVSNRLQDEMEKLRQLADDANYDRIALSGAPAHSSDPSDPAWRVSGTSYAVNRNGTGLQQMVFDGGGVAPTTHFSSGDVDGTINRFVVWEPSSACPPPNDPCVKRVIVSIKLDTTGSAGTRRYQEIQSLIADPRAPENQTAPPPGGDVTPWSFWLTDTPCNNDDRQALAGDHATHNTRGVCATGLKDANDCVPGTGCSPGAPDLMVTHPPPVFSEEPLINFATDVLSPTPSQDKGLRTIKPGTNGCPALSIAQGPEQVTSPNPPRYQEIHKWLSPAIPTGASVQLNGRGAFNLWTRTVAGVSYPARICVWLFQRTVNGLGVPQDTAAVNLDASNVPYWQYSASAWSSDKWGEISIPLHFTLSALNPGSRLGVAVQVERAGTTGGGLQFLYDEPSFESRLEVKTTSALPF
jgi:Tfp pilus assembly protein PilV